MVDFFADLSRRISQFQFGNLDLLTQQTLINLLLPHNTINIVLIRNLRKMQHLILLPLIKRLSKLEYLILDNQLPVHLLKAIHIPLIIILQILDEIDLEDDEFSDGIAELHFALGFEQGELLADLGIF